VTNHRDVDLQVIMSTDKAVLKQVRCIESQIEIVGNHSLAVQKTLKPISTTIQINFQR